MLVFHQLCRTAMGLQDFTKLSQVLAMGHAQSAAVCYMGPETAKFLCPYRVVLERGTTRSP